MTSVNQQKDAPEKELSPKEMEALKEKMTDYYTSQIPLLEIQKTVENLSADIEEARLRRMVAAVRQAQIMAGPKEESENPDAGKPTRTLRKTE